MTHIPDPCRTPRCRNLAVPGLRYCAVCQSRLVDGMTNPPPVALDTDSPTAEDLERAYVGLVYDAARQGDDPQTIIRRQQRVIREQQVLVESMEGEVAYYQRQVSYAESHVRGLEDQLDALRRIVEHNLALDAAPPRTRNGGLLAAIRRLVGWLL